MQPTDRPTSANLKVTEEAAERLRTTAASATARLRFRVTQSAALVAALALAEKHGAEFAELLKGEPK